MAHPIAGVNEYRYGECGYIVDGALLKNNVKLKNIRIYKQRSVNIYDLMDYDTNVIYQYVRITGYDSNTNVLDYSKTDDEILNEIPVNTFFVRGYNNDMSVTGFVIRFQHNKVCLADGRYMFDMYVPECNINPPEIGEVTVSTIAIGSTTVTGTISSSSGSLDTTGMVVTMVLEGVTYTATLDGRNFTFNNVLVTETGTAVITITSPKYVTKEISVPVVSEADSDYVTMYAVSGPAMTNNGDGTYSYTLSSTVHGRGSNVVVQVQNIIGTIYNPDVNVDNSGNIKVTQTDNTDFDIIIVGPTNERTVYNTPLVWVTSGSNFSMSIQYTTHLKQSPSLSVYDASGQMVQVLVIIDNLDNITLESSENFIGKVVITGVTA
jgi:hypothetical protein